MHSYRQEKYVFFSAREGRQRLRIQVNPDFAEEKADSSGDSNWAKYNHASATLAAAQELPPHKKEIIQTALLAPQSLFLV